MNDLIQKLEQSIENLKNKSAKIYFFVQDTKGNARASVRYIYEMALTLKNLGYNTHILHEKPDYFGVQDWLGSHFMELPHTAVEGQNLQISPEDFIIVPEIFGYVMSQINNLPCAKVVLCQSYDYIFDTLQPGQTWPQFGFTKCITTSESMKDYVSKTVRNCSIDILEPTISKDFVRPKFPAKPIVAVHTREQRDAINFIKSFYAKFPQYRWISFRDMRGLSQKEFADILKDCMVSIWVDDISSFGTFPLESMASGVPVIGKAPSLVPTWINENNGIWIQEKTRLQDILADYIQNWLEDNVSENLYTSGVNTAEKFQDQSKFENRISEIFQNYFENRLESFENELNKHQEEQKA